MNVTVQIPDDLAQRIIAEGDDMQRRALEGLVAEEYRAGRLTHPDVRRMLGFATHYELDGFLKARGLSDPYDLEDLEKDRADLTRMGI